LYYNIATLLKKIKIKRRELNWFKIAKSIAVFKPIEKIKN